jgi:hypothetical protein
MAKEKKQRADHYEPKLVVKGEFIDVINASLGIKTKPKDKPAKRAAKKKG